MTVELRIISSIDYLLESKTLFFFNVIGYLSCLLSFFSKRQKRGYFFNEHDSINLLNLEIECPLIRSYIKSSENSNDKQK